MAAAGYTIYIFYPYTMSYAETPFEGTREEMLEIAGELQERALQMEEKGMYLVRPIQPEEPETSHG